MLPWSEPGSRWDHDVVAWMGRGGKAQPALGCPAWLPWRMASQMAGTGTGGLGFFPREWPQHRASLTLLRQESS